MALPWRPVSPTGGSGARRRGGAAPELAASRDVVDLHVPDRSRGQTGLDIAGPAAPLVVLGCDEQDLALLGGCEHVLDIVRGNEAGTKRS